MRLPCLFLAALIILTGLGFATPFISVVGGNITQLTNSSGTFNIITCTSNCTLIVSGSGPAAILMVGGGGGAGSDIQTGTSGGGGGAGQYLYMPVFNLSPGTYNVVVGIGGLGGINRVTPGVNGTATSIINSSSNYTAFEGSGGKGYGGATGKGASTGAGADTATPGTAFAGNQGGTQTGGSGAASGGGCNSTGVSGSDSAARPGGTGCISNITGTQKVYSAGGPSGPYTAGAMADGANGVNPGDGGAGATGGTSGSATGGNGSNGIFIMAFIGSVADSCVNLNTANQVKTLVGDVISTGSGSCFNISADNITLDCAGHTILGDSTASSAGVAIGTNIVNSSIKNCVVYNFDYGIHHSGSRFGWMFNNTIHNSSSYGLLMENIAENFTIANNTINNSHNYSIYFNTASHNNYLFNNTIINSSDAAFYLLNVKNINLTKNFVNGTLFGIYLNNANNTRAINNTFIDNSSWKNVEHEGFHLNQNSYNNTFLGNNITAPTWVDDANNAVPGQNYYNGSNSGNIYYFRNGTPSWLVFNITSIGGVWATGGASRPFNNSNVGNNFTGVNLPNDWFPYTLNTQPPIISNLTLTPVLAFVNSTLACNITANSSNSQQINISYSWLLNGTNQTALAGTYNVTNNTAFLINLTLTGLTNVSDNWSCAVQGYDGFATSVMNYSQNITIVATSSISSQLIPSPAYANSTIWGYAVVSTGGGATTAVIGWVLFENGSAYSNGTTTAAIGANASLFNRTGVHKGAILNLTANATLNDGSTTINYTSNLTISNFVPIVAALNISANNSVYQIGTIQANITAEDADLDALTLYYTWFKNGVNNTAGSTATTNGSLVSLSFPGPFVVGDNYNIFVQVSDGTASSGGNTSSNTTIANFALNYTSNYTATQFDIYQYAYQLNLTIPATIVPTATLYIFGNSYAPTTSNTSTTYYFSWLVITPVQAFDQNYSGNMTFLVNSTYLGAVFFNITALQGGLINCSASSNITAVYRFYDSINYTAINLTNSQAFSYSDAYRSRSYGTSGQDVNATICTRLTNTSFNFTSTESYSASGYQAMSLNRFGVLNGTAQNFNIFLIPTASARSVLFTIRQTIGGPGLQGYTILNYKYINSNSSYVLIASSMTDNTGRVIQYLEQTPTIYNLVALDTNNVVVWNETNRFYCAGVSATDQCTYSIVLTNQTINYYGELVGQQDLGNLCTYNNVSRILSCTYTANTGTQFNATFLNLTITGPNLNNMSVVAGNQTSYASSHTITALVPNVNGTYAYTFIGFFVGNQQNGYLNAYDVLETGYIQINPQPSLNAGPLGWLLAFLLVIVVSYVFLQTPFLIPVAAAFTTIACALLGLIVLSPITIGGIAIAGVVTSFLMSR